MSKPLSILFNRRVQSKQDRVISLRNYSLSLFHGPGIYACQKLSTSRPFTKKTCKGQTLDNKPTTEASKDGKTWNSFRESLESIKDSIASIRDIKYIELAQKFVPDFPEWLTKMSNSFSVEKGSLMNEIWKESRDPNRNPELLQDAQVRQGNGLCKEELDFIRKRQSHIVKSLAQYLEMEESEIDYRDVPIIAIAASGGGYRAMLGTTGYLQAAELSGLFQCTTYLAGVSGSCWATALYMTVGRQSFSNVLDHLKSRMNIHIANLPALLDLISSASTKKYLVRGLVEKYRQSAEIGLVDIYGTLLAARLMVPNSGIPIDDNFMKLSNQANLLENASIPMPIYTAVRHEIPSKARATQNASKQTQSWFQWFEFTPYEVGCEELQAWIPTWGLGRRYENSRNTNRVPETKLPILLGVFGSAFCATLSHYYAEARYFLPKGGMFKSLDDMIRDFDKGFQQIHPIDPATFPNYVLGMQCLPLTCSTSLREEKMISLMDGGMSNNLPFYPLLRREIDIIITFDSSADMQNTPWFERTDGYTKQRNIKGWPVGAGWPRQDENATQTIEESSATTKSEAFEKLESARDNQKKGTLGPCSIWIGSLAERTNDSPQSEMIRDDFKLVHKHDGIALVYFPLVPNDKVEGVNPEKSEWMSTWNFEYTPHQIDQIISLTHTNFSEGEDRVKKLIRAIYERKKNARLKESQL